MNKKHVSAKKMGHIKVKGMCCLYHNIGGTFKRLTNEIYLKMFEQTAEFDLFKAVELLKTQYPTGVPDGFWLIDHTVRRACYLPSDGWNDELVNQFNQWNKGVMWIETDKR